MFDIIVLGAGIAGSSFAYKSSKYAKTLLIEVKEKESLPISTNIYPEHNKEFLKSDEVNYSDKSMFPCVFRTINYMDKNQDGIINSDDFGAPFGYISYTEKLIGSLLDKFEDQGGIARFNEKVSKISRSNEKVEIITNKGESFEGKIVAIATGSYDFDLQRSLGFGAPDSYYGIYTHFFGDEDTLKKNIKTDYTFHLNSNVSQNGPLFINRGIDRISVGFLGSEKITYEDLNSKFERILNNYKPIQSFIKDLKRAPSKPVFGKISKHPISQFSKNRSIVLGEAAGLVTAFFYEGLLGGVACAELATRTVKTLFEKESNFAQDELKSYDGDIKQILDPYYKTGEASEILFYNSGSKFDTLWDVYTKLIKSNKTVKKYIWEAIIRQDIENHDIQRDKWTGEQIFNNLPLLSKVTYWPHFLKAMIK